MPENGIADLEIFYFLANSFHFTRKDTIQDINLWFGDIPDLENFRGTVLGIKSCFHFLVIELFIMFETQSYLPF